MNIRNARPTFLGLLVLASAAQLLTAQHVDTDRSDARALPLPKEDGVFHFVVYGDRTGGPPEGVEVLRQAVADTNLLDPDLVMTVGDLIQGYNTTDPWLEQMREYHGIMEKLEMPWYPVAGNHDIYWRGGQVPKQQHEDHYEEHFGPLWYWFEHKNCGFVVLFSDEGDLETGERGYRKPSVNQFSAPQLSWLQKTLAKAAKLQHVFVFLHHPKWRSSYVGSNWDHVHQLLVGAGNVRAVFAGHIHRMTYAGVRDGIEYLTLATVGGGLSGEIPGMGLLHHLNVVTVRDGGIEMATIPVGQVLDPRAMTDEARADMAVARDITGRTVSSPLVVEQSGMIDGEVRCEIRNPCAERIEVSASLEVNGGGWFFMPDHAHRVLAPGESWIFATRVLRESIGLKRFVEPKLVVQVDYLVAAGARVAMPAHEMGLSLDFAKVDLSAAGAVDGVDRVVELGGDGYLEVGPDAFRDLPDGPLTLECWMRADSLRRRTGLLAKTEGSEFGIFVSNGVAEFSVHLDGHYVNGRDDAPALETGRWAHVAGVFDGKEVRTYVDGRLVARAEGTGARTRNEFPLVIGGDVDRRGRGTSLFRGAIDEVRLSTVARYEGESFDPRERFEPDGATWMLLHFDAVVGPFHVDASSHGHHARAVREVKLVPQSAGGLRD